VRIQYGATDITIPNAQLQDTTMYQSNAIIRENRGFAPISFKASEWPVNITRKFSIKTMTDAERVALLNLLIASAADEILITDHDDQDWLGIVITAIPELVTIMDDCNYDVEFEFLCRRTR